MSEFLVCLYCKKCVNDHYSNLCCHSVDIFIQTAKSVYKCNTKMLDDFVRSQPVNLVKDAIMESSDITIYSMIPVDFYKIRDLVVKYIAQT